MKFTLATLMILTSLSSFASIQRPANPNEKAAMCKAIDAALEEEQADMALNTPGCLKANMVVTGLEIGGSRISARVPFRSPNRANFEQVCSAMMMGMAIDKKSIVCR